MLRLRRVALAVVSGLAALEVALQIAALVTTFTAASPGPGPKDGAPVVLCIGDSYTYGMGASAAEHSYPAELERLLARGPGPAPSVVNAGWSGRNSREAVLQLPDQLETRHPRVVCVLIGLNDSWTYPKPVEAPELAGSAPGRWQWRWRTWRLVQVLLGGGGKVAPPVTSAQAAGSKDGGTKAFLQQVVARIKAGQHAEALAMLERALRDDPANAAEYHQGIVQVHMATGQRARAAESLAWLQREYAERPAQKVTEAYATALWSAGERQQAAALARAAVQSFPGCSSLWWLSGQGYYDAGDLAAAERELDHAIDTVAADAGADWRATVRRDCARAACARDLGKALRLMVAAMEMDEDVERCRLIVAGAPQVFTADAVRAAVRDQQLSAGDLERLQRLFGSGWTQRTGMCTVLKQHLRQIVATCREHGARVVLLTYPLPVDDIEAVQGEVATEMGVPLIRCLPRFAAELQHRPREELYIRDGHCTDAGYVLMAEICLDAVARELQR